MKMRNICMAISAVVTYLLIEDIGQAILVAVTVGAWVEMETTKTDIYTNHL